MVREVGEREGEESEESEDVMEDREEKELDVRMKDSESMYAF